MTYIYFEKILFKIIINCHFISIIHKYNVIYEFLDTQDLPSHVSILWLFELFYRETKQCVDPYREISLYVVIHLRYLPVYYIVYWLLISPVIDLLLVVKEGVQRIILHYEMNSVLFNIKFRVLQYQVLKSRLFIIYNEY